MMRLRVERADGSIEVISLMALELATNKEKD
jgi:hypothetical protein